MGERESSYTSTPLWKETKVWKGKLFERKANLITGILFIFYFVLNFIKRVTRLLACVVAYDSFYPTCFWQPESAPPSYCNVCTCVNVWPLCLLYRGVLLTYFKRLPKKKLFLSMVSAGNNHKKDCRHLQWVTLGQSRAECQLLTHVTICALDFEKSVIVNDNHNLYPRLVKFSRIKYLLCMICALTSSNSLMS